MKLVLPTHVVLDHIIRGNLSFAYISEMRQCLLRMKNEAEKDGRFAAEFWGCIDGGNQKSDWAYNKSDDHLSLVPLPVRDMLDYIYVLNQDNSYTFIKVPNDVFDGKIRPLFSYDIIKEPATIPAINAASRIRTP